MPRLRNRLPHLPAPRRFATRSRERNHRNLPAPAPSPFESSITWRSAPPTGPARESSAQCGSSLASPRMRVDQFLVGFNGERFSSLNSGQRTEIGGKTSFQASARSAPPSTSRQARLRRSLPGQPHAGLTLQQLAMPLGCRRGNQRKPARRRFQQRIGHALLPR